MIAERPRLALPGATGWEPGELRRRVLVATPLAAIGFAIAAFGGVYGWAYGCAYLLIFGTLGVWAGLAWRGRERLRWRATYLPILLFGALALAQLGTGASVVAASTVTALLHLSAGAALYVVLSQCYRGERDAGWITTSFSVFTAALALLAILQILTASHGIYWHFTYTYASPAGSFVNRNHFAGCMEMLLPLACVEGYRRRHQDWLHLLPWALPPGLGLAAVILAASRGGIAALGVEVLAGAGLMVFCGLLPGRRARAGALGAVALVAALVLVVGTRPLQARLEQTNLHAPSWTQRQQLNLSTRAMIAERPLDGWGLGTWGNVYPAFSQFTDPSTFVFAHNDYLQLLAETGGAGAACLLLFWSLWGWELAQLLTGAGPSAASPRAPLVLAPTWGPGAPSRRLRLAGAAPPRLPGAGRPAELRGLSRRLWLRCKRRDPRVLRGWRKSEVSGSLAAPLSAAALIGCLGILAHSWVDFNLHIPANLLLLLALAALALPESLETHPRETAGE